MATPYFLGQEMPQGELGNSTARYSGSKAGNLGLRIWEKLEILNLERAEGKKCLPVGSRWREGGCE